MFSNKKSTKLRQLNESKLLKHGGKNRIIEEVTNDNDIDNDNTIDTMGNFNNDLDIKYELFCKWLQQNGSGAQLIHEIDRPNFCNVDAGGATLTEDEVSSFATNSDDDSSNDVFLDTESEQPMIMVNGMHEIENADVDAAAATNSTVFRVNTPSQLSTSDYEFDCSASDVTVNSNGNPKRKPKHKKGRAPPIPAAAAASAVAALSENSINLARKTDI